jgi:hypothetical protein
MRLGLYGLSIVRETREKTVRDFIQVIVSLPDACDSSIVIKTDIP